MRLRRRQDVIVVLFVVMALCSITGIYFLGLVTADKWDQDTRSQVAAGDTTLDVSMPELIVAPARYDGKLVRVTGFCNLEFEGNALYNGKTNLGERNTKSGLWLNNLWPIPDKYISLSGEYVVVEGVVDSLNKGHMGAFAASLKDVRRIEKAKTSRTP